MIVYLLIGLGGSIFCYQYERDCGGLVLPSLSRACAVFLAWPLFAAVLLFALLMVFFEERLR